MNKIKVYLQKPMFFSDSPYYEYLTKNVSDKVNYINIDGKNQGIIEDVRKFKTLNKFKRVVKLTIRNFFPWMPNARYTKNDETYDITHCAHCLSLNKKPWICDIEYVNQFWAGGIPKKQKSLIKKMLLDDNCKKILAWTEWTKRGILKEFPEIKEKVEVVYPALPIGKAEKKKGKKVNLLFVSRRFYFKGGLHAVEIMDRVTKKYNNVNALVISDTPKEILRKYAKNGKIKFMKVIPKEKLFSEIYPKTDILIYPSYTDTFGFTIIEALSFGIPVVTVSGQSRNELVSDGKTGFVIRGPNKLDIKSLEGLNSYRRIIDELEEKTEILIKSKKLRERMSKNALNEVLNGNFSIENRNKKLEKTYTEALRK